MQDFIECFCDFSFLLDDAFEELAFGVIGFLNFFGCSRCGFYQTPNSFFV
jgi:hypothetical protein